MTTCLLFVTFENLGNQTGAAVEHLRSGVAVLRQWKPKTLSEQVLKEDYLSPVYTRSFESVDNNDDYQRFCERFLELATDPRDFHNAIAGMPDSFEDIYDARKKLQTLLDVLFPLIASLIDSADDRGLQATIARARRLLHDWSTRFENLPAVLKDIRSPRATILLRLQYEMGLILLTAIPLDTEQEYDSHISSFRNIVEQCQQFLIIEEGLVSSQGPRPPYICTLLRSWDHSAPLLYGELLSRSQDSTRSNRSAADQQQARGRLGR